MLGVLAVSRARPETFAETFEAAAFEGVESLAVTSTVCPTGESTLRNDDAAVICDAS